jgi:hypothetical protein
MRLDVIPQSGMCHLRLFIGRLLTIAKESLSWGFKNVLNNADQYTAKDLDKVERNMYDIRIRMARLFDPIRIHMIELINGGVENQPAETLKGNEV